MPKIVGVSDVTVSLPHLVGGSGIIASFPPQLSDEECERLNRSAMVIKEAIDELDASQKDA